MTNVYGPMTPERKSRIWELWRQEQPMSFIAGDINKPPATVYSYLLYHGGIEPRSRIPHLGALSVEERELISRGLASGKSIRNIAGGYRSSSFDGFTRNLQKWRSKSVSSCFSGKGFFKAIEKTQTTASGSKCSLEGDSKSFITSRLVARADIRLVEKTAI